MCIRDRVHTEYGIPNSGYAGCRGPSMRRVNGSQANGTGMPRRGNISTFSRRWWRRPATATVTPLEKSAGSRQVVGDPVGQLLASLPGGLGWRDASRRLGWMMAVESAKAIRNRANFTSVSANCGARICALAPCGRGHHKANREFCWVRGMRQTRSLWRTPYPAPFWADANMPSPARGPARGEGANASVAMQVTQ